MSRTPKRKNPGAREKTGKAVGPSPQHNLLIVAIGASAGGIEAFSELISHLPPGTGMAYVLIQQLDPKQHGMLTELITKSAVPRRAVADKTPSLSRRELQILRSLVDGKANKEIAGYLRLSCRTVETYRARLMFKVGAKSTAEVVRYAIRNALVEA